MNVNVNVEVIVKGRTNEEQRHRQRKGHDKQVPVDVVLNNNERLTVSELERDERSHNNERTSNRQRPTHTWTNHTKRAFRCT